MERILVLKLALILLFVSTLAGCFWIRPPGIHYVDPYNHGGGNDHGGGHGDNHGKKSHGD